MSYQYKTNVPKAKKRSAESERKGPEPCKLRLGQKGCDRCAQVTHLFTSEDERDHEVAKKARAKSSYYINVVDLEEKPHKVRYYRLGIENWRTLIEFLPDPDDVDEIGTDYTDPDNASIVVLKRTGKGLNTDYTIQISPKKFKMPSTWLENMWPLHKILEVIAKGDPKEDEWKPKSGRNRLAVLPPWGEEAGGDFFKEVWYHWSTHLLGDVVGDGEEFGLEEDGFMDDFGEEGTDASTSPPAEDDDIPF